MVLVTFYKSFLYNFERETGLEPAISSMARKRVAITPLPLIMCRGTESNRRPSLFQRDALPLSYRGFSFKNFVGGGGLEPPTLRTSSARSSQLS